MTVGSEQAADRPASSADVADDSRVTLSDTLILTGSRYSPAGSGLLSTRASTLIYAASSSPQARSFAAAMLKLGCHPRTQPVHARAPRCPSHCYQRARVGVGSCPMSVPHLPSIRTLSRWYSLPRVHNPRGAPLSPFRLQPDRPPPPRQVQQV